MLWSAQRAVLLKSRAARCKMVSSEMRATGGKRRLVIRGVVFDADQLARLDAVAARERRSRSFVIRDAVEDLLVRDERRHPDRDATGFSW